MKRPYNDFAKRNGSNTHWIDYLIMAAGVLVLIALPFIIADLIWGAEMVTEWVAGLI
jgi:hypothetical protein